MTNETLAGYSNVALYSAMAVLTLAMIAHGLYLARLVPHRELLAERSRERELDRELVGANAAGAPPRRPAPPASEEVLADEPATARKAGGIGRSLTILGTLLLLVSIALRGLSVERAPLGNLFEFACAAAAFTLLGYLAWSARRDLRWLGLFVLVPVVLLLGVAMTVWYTEAAELMPSLKSVWLAIHVTVATLSVGLCIIGFALAALYLLKDRSPGGRIQGFLDRLPATPVLERLCYGIHIVAFPLWTFTLIAGAIWARQAWGSYWNWDPKEVWTFIIWVIYAAYLHARATAGWSRRSATWIAVAGFLAIVVNYTVVNFYFVGQHSYSGLS